MTDNRNPYSIVVLVSGGGTNLQAMIDAIHDGSLKINIRAVISNVPNAYALERATNAGIESVVIDHTQYASREAFDHALLDEVNRLDPDLLVLAGFMRILSDSFFERSTHQMINIHPSLLPDYRGLNTHERVLAAGEKFHGASVHFVTPELDAGAVIVRGVVEIDPNDTAQTLQQRVHQQEYRIYPLALAWLAGGRVSVVDNDVLIDGKRQPEQSLDL